MCRSNSRRFVYEGLNYIKSLISLLVVRSVVPNSTTVLETVSWGLLPYCCLKKRAFEDGGCSYRLLWFRSLGHLIVLQHMRGRLAERALPEGDKGELRVFNHTGLNDKG